MRELRWVPFVLVMGLLGLACGGDDASDMQQDAADAGEAAPTAAARVAPTEAELCTLTYGESHRDDIEKLLGKADGSRENTDDVLLDYDYFDVGLTLLLHVRNDVFMGFTVYGGRVPQCWADEERMTEWRPSTDAGAAPDSQTW